VRKLYHKCAYKFCLKHNRVVGITNTGTVGNFGVPVCDNLMFWESVLLEIVRLCGSVNFKSVILSVYFVIASRFRLRDLEENRRLQVLTKISCFFYFVILMLLI
jgi:hypothetical protein